MYFVNVLIELFVEICVHSMEFELILSQIPFMRSRVYLEYFQVLINHSRKNNDVDGIRDE